MVAALGHEIGHRGWRLRLKVGPGMPPLSSKMAFPLPHSGCSLLGRKRLSFLSPTSVLLSQYGSAEDPRRIAVAEAL